MSEHVDPQQKNLLRSQQPSHHEEGNSQSAGNSFADNRAEVVAQQKRQAMANQSPQVQQLKAIQQMASPASFSLHAAPLEARGEQHQETRTEMRGGEPVQLYRTSFSANELTEPVGLRDGRTAQLLTIQRAGDDKPAKLHIHADLDAPGMALVDQLQSGEVGHAWISLEWKDPSNVPEGMHDDHKSFLQRGGVMADPMGFWPKMFTDYDPLTDQWGNLPDDERASYSSNPFNSYVAGQMVHPDNLHSPKATQTYELTQDQASAVINYAESKRGAQYSVFYYNCTTFAKQAAKAGGQSPPSMGKLGICYPDALYKSIVKNQRNQKGTTTVYTDAGATTVEGEAAKKG